MGMAEASPSNTNVTWFDDGDIHHYQFAKYGEKKTYCFYPNATLSFRMEPLMRCMMPASPSLSLQVPSPSQPYVVQWLGQYEEARVVADMAAAYITQLQVC